jgi:hypothetical protein
LKFSDYAAISADFGKLLVTNLMVINAGALLVFPSLLDGLKKESINLGFASLAATLFVIGLILAGLCGYAAYINYMCLGLSKANEDNLLEFKAKCTPEMLKLDQNINIISKIEKDILFNDWVGMWTLYLGNFLGISSGAIFCAGCYYVKAAIL